MSIDTLAYAKDLQAAGLPAEQAEVHARALNKALQDGVATKADLAAMEEHIDARMIRYLAIQAFGIVSLTTAITAALLGLMK